MGYPAKWQGSNGCLNTNTNTNTMNTIINSTIAQLAAPQNLVADILRFSDLRSASASLKETIVTEVRNLIKSSGVSSKDAYASLKKEVIAAGLDKRRASEVFIDLGFRERSKKSESKGKKEKDAELAPVIEALVALAQEKAGEDAISALRRAYLTLQAKNNA